MQYAEMFKAAQRLTSKPVKFGTVTPELVAFAVQDEHYKSLPDRIMALSDAFNEELHDLADAGCPVIQMEEPQIHLLAARGYVDKVINPEFMLKVFNNTVQGAAGEDRGVVPHVLGEPVAAADVRQRAELQAGAGAAEPGGRRRDHVRDEELEPDGPRGLGAAITEMKVCVGAIDHHTLQVEAPTGGRGPHPAGVEGDSGGAAGAEFGLRDGARGDEPAARLLQDGVAGAGHQPRQEGTGAAGDGEPGGGSEVLADSDDVARSQCESSNAEARTPTLTFQTFHLQEIRGSRGREGVAGDGPRGEARRRAGIGRLARV